MRLLRRPGGVRIRNRVAGEPGLSGAVGVHDVYLVGPVSLVLIGGRGKGDLGAVWRPGRMFILGVDGQPGPVGPVGVHGVNLIWCHHVSDNARRGVEDDLGSVGGPGRAQIYCRAAGQPGLARSVGVHDIDFDISHRIRIVRVPIRDKSDLGAIEFIDIGTRPTITSTNS